MTVRRRPQDVVVRDRSMRVGGEARRMNAMKRIAEGPSLLELQPDGQQVHEAPDHLLELGLLAKRHRYASLLYWGPSDAGARFFQSMERF